MYHIVYDVSLNLTSVVQTNSGFTSKMRQTFNSLTVNRNNQPSNPNRNNKLLLLKDLLIVLAKMNKFGKIASGKSRLLAV